MLVLTKGLKQDPRKTKQSEWGCVLKYLQLFVKQDMY